MTILRALAFAAAVLVAGPAFAQMVSAPLNGDQEVPSISTAGTGTIDIASAGGGVFDYTLTYQDLEAAPLQAHIHFGQSSVDGGITVWLCSNVGAPVTVPACTASPAVVVGSFDASDILAIVAQGLAAELNALLAAGNAGLLYANVHTESFPGGEIRGQID